MAIVFREHILIGFNFFISIQFQFHLYLHLRFTY